MMCQSVTELHTVSAHAHSAHVPFFAYAVRFFSYCFFYYYGKTCSAPQRTRKTAHGFGA